ncbi:MAG: putative ABC transporter permease subunit [Bradymonadia bacterium]
MGVRQKSPQWRQPWSHNTKANVVVTLLMPAAKRVRTIFRPKKRTDLTRNLIFVLFAVGFMLGTGLAARWLFSKFAAVETLAHLLITRTISMALLFFSGLLIFSNLISAFTTFFLAPELERLRSDPVSTTQLCLARLMTNWSQTSWSMFLFLLPMLWGAGPALNASIDFYVVVLVSLLPLTIMCAVTGTTICVLLTRTFPAKRSRDVLILFAIIAFVIGYIAFRLAEPEKYLEPGGFKDLIALITSVESDTQGLSPVYWVTDALMSTIKDDLTGLSQAVLLLYSAAYACAYLGTMLSARLYHMAYSSAHERPASQNIGPKQIKQRAWRHQKNSLAAIVHRDRLTFVRTPSQWTQLLLVGALIVVYLLNFKYFRSLQDSGILGNVGIFAINFGLSGLIIATLAVRFLFPSISLEGKAFWCIESAPIDHDTLFKAKRSWGVWPIIVIGTSLCAGAGVITGLSLPLIALSIIITAIYSWTVCSMGTYLGGFDPQFNLDNPARVASSMTAVVFMMSAMFILVAQLGLSLQPVWLVERIITSDTPPASRSYAIAIGLVTILILICIGATKLTRRIGLNGLARRYQ